MLGPPAGEPSAPRPARSRSRGRRRRPPRTRGSADRRGAAPTRAPTASRSGEPDRRRCASASTSRTSTRNGDGRGGSVDGSGPPRVGTASNVALSSRAWNDATIEKMTSPSWTARTCRAENEPPSRSRSTCRITGRSTRPGPEEVAVQRVRQPVGGHRRARGAQRLRRDLAAVQRHARARAGFVLAAEEIAVEHLEVEQRREAARRRVPNLSSARVTPRPVTCPVLRTIISVQLVRRAWSGGRPCCSPA